MDDLRFTIAPADLSEDDFMAKYGGIYEHAPWVAARLFGAGLGPQDSRLSIVAGRMADIVDAAGHDAQMALLRAHPELAGKLAIAGGRLAPGAAPPLPPLRPRRGAEASRGGADRGPPRRERP